MRPLVPTILIRIAKAGFVAKLVFLKQNLVSQGSGFTLTNLFFYTDLANGACWAYAGAKSAGNLTVALGHDEMGRPETSHTCFCRVGFIAFVGQTFMHNPQR